MQPVQEKHVRLDFYFATSTAQLNVAAGAWPDLEAQYPSLRVSVVESPGESLGENAITSHTHTSGQARHLLLSQAKLRVMMANCMMCRQGGLSRTPSSVP